MRLHFYKLFITGKSLSEALIFELINPKQIVHRITKELAQAQNMFCPCSGHVLRLKFSLNSMNNLLSYCGLVDARISASEKAYLENKLI